MEIPVNIGAFTGLLAGVVRRSSGENVSRCLLGHLLFL
ncbi:hypothetical protein BRO54_0089 [Geobacillus proteiniphilus]|uniref:Uncharacterized protein n=1 Tax=Geobacillus proteiniphilus TaxID=860353 RepID=A0A1Q5TA13_9BACL|nr:hypothetical protein BRO54_0089 [Geobacillus proteiniphilus]